MTNQQNNIYHNNAYIDKYNSVPITRISRLIPLIKLRLTDRVADFACGGGILADLIHDKVNKYYGIDFSEKFIELAQGKQYYNVTFICQNISDFCSKHPEFFDVAFALDFTEHISDDEFKDLFAAIRSSLNKGGKLYIHTPNGLYFIEFLKKYNLIKQIPGHIAVRTQREYEKLLKSLGYNNIVTKKLCHYLAPMSWLHFLSYLPLIGNVFAARLFISCER